MFSFLKRNSQKKEEVTFKDRVQNFWRWYLEVAPRFYTTIEAKNSSSLVEEVSTKADEMLPNIAWVFGPGANGKGHSFTISGEGSLHRQLLAMYWLNQAPLISGWTFYCARQPGSVQNISLETGGKVFRSIESWMAAYANNQTEKVDLTAWHPLFESMPEKEKWRVLFLLLDEALGEFGTQQWIGEIILGNEKLAEAMPLHELGKFLNKVEIETGWKKYPPGECWTGYRIKEQHQRFLRGDVFAGSTVNDRLINEYLDAEGELSDPLAGTGADYVFVSFDAQILPEGKQVDARSAIEDAIADSLRRNSSGQLLGGASGTQNAYIDLLLFDGRNSLELVRQALTQQQLPEGTSINYFAKEKRGHRIVL